MSKQSLTWWAILPSRARLGIVLLCIVPLSMLPLSMLLDSIDLSFDSAVSAGEPDNLADDDSATGTESTKLIDGWIQDLNSDEFRVRRRATTKLMETGKSSIGLLEKRVVDADREGVVRVLSILTELSFSTDVPTSEAARSAVSRLTKSAVTHVARLAQSVLEQRLARAIARIEGMGGRVYMANGTPYSVYFDGTEVEDEDLVVLREMTDVIQLSLGTTKITSAGLKHIVHLKKLQKLNLFQSRVGDEGLKYLKELPSLVSVPMGYTQVTDAGLAHLSNLIQLDYLGLRGDNVTSGGLVHLQKLTNLTGLYLGETKVTDEGLVHLKDMTKMEHLRLHNSAITDAGIEHLKPLVNLAVVEVFNSKITAVGVKRLKELFPDVEVVAEE
ncbi:MAG: hypothetical protein ACI9G1_003668 [Pirellulaceae bacterium]|jgi:hypothetical protein